MPRITGRQVAAISARCAALLAVTVIVGCTPRPSGRQVVPVTSSEVGLAVAEKGLQTYLGTLKTDTCGRAVRPADHDSVRIEVAGGFAWVHAHVVQRPADSLGNWLYIVWSTGAAVESSIGPQPRARRTVARFARWRSNPLGLRATWTAANGIVGPTNSRADGEFRGRDQAPRACRDSSVAAIRTPAGQAPSGLHDFTLNGTTPPIVSSGSARRVADSTFIDWSAIVSGAIEPHYTSLRLRDWTYPTQFVAGDLTIGDSISTDYGAGLLIVTGDLRIASSFFQWYGVVLVGGNLHLEATDQRFDGLVASGLNEQLGIDVEPTTLGRGDYTDMDFNSAFVRASLSRLLGWIPVGGMRTDEGTR